MLLKELDKGGFVYGPIPEDEKENYGELMVSERFHLPEDEHFFGLGAFKNPLDLRGTTVQCVCSELGESGKGGGFPTPWVLSSAGYGLFVDNVDESCLQTCRMR